MPRLSSQERFWKEKLSNPASTDAEKVKAAEELEKIKRRHTRIKFGVVNRHKKQGYDPRPEFNEDEGYSAFWEKLAAWEQRHPEVKQAPAPAVKIEQPKPALVVEVAALPVVPKPAPVKRPAPAPVVRKAREGHSGKFFNENFWSKDIFERNMILKTLNTAQQSEWDTIQSHQAMEAARVAAAHPKETPKPMSEMEKQAAFSPPIMIQTPAAGQPMTVDEMRETYGSTMGTVTLDSGISPELDRRGWLPNCKPEELTPSG
jgi:hypothetical protein